MDQDSRRGSGGDKRNWRERLGINKDLPKISQDFDGGQRPRGGEPRLDAGSPAPARAPSSGAARDAGQVTSRPPAGAKPVQRPAPMAPRRPSGAGSPGQSAAPQRSATPPRPTPPPVRSQTRPAQPPASPAQPPAPTGDDDFGQRLRAQREAAERLAQQRASVPRQAAEQPMQSSVDAQQQHRRPAGQTRPVRPPQAPQPAAPRPTQAVAPPDGGPKFTFADEELSTAVPEQPQRASQARPDPAPHPPAMPDAPPARRVWQAPPPPPQMQPRTPAGPVPGHEAAYGYADAGQPPAGYAPDPRARPPARYADQQVPQGYGDPHPQPPAGGRHAPAEYDPRSIRPPAQPEEGGAYQRAPMPGPNARRPARGRNYDYLEDDLDDVFEEEAPRKRERKRATAADYNEVYRDYDDIFDDEDTESRGSGPLLLILALVVIALVAGALIYFYNVTSQSSSTSGGGNVPVVIPPEQPAKVQPQQPSASQPARQPAGRKQIYDRILGEDAPENNQLVPTEETPSQPAAPQPGATQPPASNAPSSGGVEPLPIPLPPPPVPGTSGQSSATPKQNSAALSAPPVPALPGQTTSPAASGQTATAQLPVPGEATAGSTQTQAPVPAAPGQTETLAASNSSQTGPPTPRPKPPETPSIAGISPQPGTSPPESAGTGADQGAGPISITPSVPAPQDQASVTPQQPLINTLPPATQAPGVQLPTPQEAQPTQPRRRVGGRAADDDFGSTSRPINTQPSQPSQPTQVAIAPAVPTQPQPAPTQPAQQQQASTGGYMIQLASFRSLQEAQAEYQRLRTRHSNLIGNLQSQIQQSDLGASGKFYRLRVGPMQSKTTATRLCNSLISAGEKDCIVRRN